MDTYPVASMEGGVPGLTNSGTLIYNEAAYYSFNNQSDITATVTVGGVPSPIPWLANAANSTYYNYNGSSATTPPVNTNPNIEVNNNNTNPSSYVYRLNPAINTGDNTGLGITIKVMAGDQVSIFAKSAWHNPSGGAINNGASLVTSVLTTFLQSLANTPAIVANMHGTVTGALLNTPNTTTPLSAILGSDNTLTGSGATQPVKAGINWILFDDQFRPVQAGSGYDAVYTGADYVKSHVLVGLPNLTMPKNGYLYVYCSNESNMDVVFDNLQIINTRGAIVEETHYYPDGLAMAGISDRAWNKLQNSFHYQGHEIQNQEFSDGNGLEDYDFGARFYDPQLGVWHNADPASQYGSPYMAMGDNWVNGRDPNGKWFLEFAIGFVAGYLSNAIETGNWGWKSLKAGLISGIGAVAGIYIGTEVASVLPATTDIFEKELISNLASSVIIGAASSVASGHSVWQGMESGAISGFMSTELADINYSKGDWARLGENFAVGGVSGGVISMSLGGNFWAGVSSGAISATLSNIPVYRATIEEDEQALRDKLAPGATTPSDGQVLDTKDPTGDLHYIILTKDQFFAAFYSYAKYGTGNILYDLVEGSDITQLGGQPSPDGGDPEVCGLHFKVGNLHFRFYDGAIVGTAPEGYYYGYGKIPLGYSLHIDNYGAAVNPILHLYIDTHGQDLRGYK